MSESVKICANCKRYPYPRKELPSLDTRMLELKEKKVFCSKGISIPFGREHKITQCKYFDHK